MNEFTLNIGSVTNGMMAQSALLSKGITSHLTKSTTAGGCVFRLTVKGDRKTALDILRNAGVSL